MKILIDENILWLRKSDQVCHLVNAGHVALPVGLAGCPGLGSSDEEIAQWCSQNDFAVLTADFNDFLKLEPRITILGINNRGYFVLRGDRVAAAIGMLLESLADHGVERRHYYLEQYRGWPEFSLTATSREE